MADWSTPSAAFDRARRDLEQAYSEVPDNLVFEIDPKAGHEETPAMRAAVLAFLAAQFGLERVAA